MVEERREEKTNWNELASLSLFLLPMGSRTLVTNLRGGTFAFIYPAKRERMGGGLDDLPTAFPLVANTAWILSKKDGKFFLLLCWPVFLLCYRYRRKTQQKYANSLSFLSVVTSCIEKSLSEFRSDISTWFFFLSWRLHMSTCRGRLAMFFRWLGIIADLVREVRPLPYWELVCTFFLFFFRFVLLSG